MVFGANVVWRYPQEREQFALCEGLLLNEGYVVLVENTRKVHVLTDVFYEPLCYNDGPVLSTFKYVGVDQLPYAASQWSQYISTETGSFKYSIYPLIYSLTVSTVMCIFLTVIVFTNHTQNPSWLLRAESALASTNLGILFVRAIVFLDKQHDLGYSSGEKLLESLQSDNVFSTIDFIVVLMAQFAQVQVIIRLFSRVKEKRVSFIIGGFLSICAQVIWGVSTFSKFDIDTDSDFSILPAFTYLLRIALAMMYCGLIIIYGFGRRSFIFQKDIMLLTILTFLVINLQFAFFITDISNVWVSELSEIFNTTIYVSVTVIPWEWINRVHALERYQQTEAAFRIGSRIKHTLENTGNTLMYFTDQVIAYGLAVPRSVSVNSSTKRVEARKKRPIITQGRKEVFVYSKKEVVCDSDNDEQTSTTTRSMDDADELGNFYQYESNETTAHDPGEGSSRDIDTHSST
ncbi:pH-response regulator protein palH/RIM21, partial [Cyberlindnera fabianii]